MVESFTPSMNATKKIFIALEKNYQLSRSEILMINWVMMKMMFYILININGGNILGACGMGRADRKQKSI